MSKPEMRDKQSVDGVCQFCGKDNFFDEETHETAEELQDGWLVLSDVTAPHTGTHSRHPPTDASTSTEVTNQPPR